MLSPISARRAHAATRSIPVSCPSEQPLATVPIFVERSPPDVGRAVQFRVPQIALDPVNAEAKSDDGNGSFLPEQVLTAESLRADDPGRDWQGARDHLPRRGCPPALPVHSCRERWSPRSPALRWRLRGLSEFDY